ncbi:hypothetical protein A4A49_63403, partial [Nicotiana attenuata]
MRKATLSLKVMKWVVEVFNVATKEHGRAIRRWNMKDHYAEFYCTLKYNEHGRYISFIAAGWEIIAQKIQRFINVPEEEKNVHIVRNPGVVLQRSNQNHHHPWGSELSYKDVLRRCIVGKVLTPVKETPTLNDIRRWACNTWKSTFGVNVYEMNDSQFLFELPSTKDAEHVLKGEWHW